MRRVFYPNGRAHEHEARQIRETFTDKPARRRSEFGWAWPARLRRIGVSMAVMYRSDKWRKPGDYQDYKHLCESRTPWTLYAAPEFAIDGIDFVGPIEHVTAGRFPDTVAILANFLGLQCRLYESTGRGAVLPPGDDGIYQLEISQAKLAAGKTSAGDLFLTVYKKQQGPQLFLFGKELDIEKDGIVG